MAFLIASLNRGTEILVQDSRDRYLNQVYYHFPEGIKYLYKRAKEDSLGKPEFEVIFNGKIKNLDYQIFLGYRTDWYPQPFIISFANDVTTICGGSLVAGIMDGMIAACKKYVIEEGLETYKIKRKKFNNGLILICSVRGADFKYGGSFKETLENEEVRKRIKRVMSSLVFEQIKANEESAKKFLLRFDESHITNRMYD